MPITQFIDTATQQNLQTKLGTHFKRLNEMYLGSPPLRDAEIFYFIEQLLEIREAIFKSAIKPALETNQGVMQSMRERISGADGTNFRIKLRSYVLLKSAVTKMNTAEGVDLEAHNFKFQEEMNDLLNERNEELVTKRCDGYVKLIKRGYNNYINSLNQLAAAKTIQKNFRAMHWNRSVRAASHIARNLKSFDAKYKRVGEAVLKVKAETAVNDMRTAVLARKNHKFVEFQKKWNQNSQGLEKLGKIIDDVNEEFTAAVVKDDATFAKARDFKKHCVSNLFSAVSSYAPAPFNLIGVIGTTVTQMAGKAFDGAVYAVEMAKQHSVADGDVRKAAVLAEETIEKMQRKVFRDHGISTNLSASQASSLTVIKGAQNDAANEFYDALELVKTDTQSSSLVESKTGYKKVQGNHFALENFRAIAKKGVVGNLENSLNVVFGSAFEKDILANVKQVEVTLAGIALPNFAINYLGSEDLIKRYLYLYLTGLYIEEKFNNQKEKLFKLGHNVTELLASDKVAFLHSNGSSPDGTNRKDGVLGMSLPYLFNWQFTSHDSYMVRVNTILRRYAAQESYNPFSILMNPSITAPNVIEYFNAQDKEIHQRIITAKNGAARGGMYHDIEGQGSQYGPLRSTGKFSA